MSLIRLLARPMLASAYVANGISRARNPHTAAKTVEPVLNAVGDKLPVDVSAATVARATGVAQAGAGVLLAIGKFPRLSASVLVSTYLFDSVGELLVGDEDDGKKTAGLLTRTSLLGGALLASVDTAGKPGLAWRAQHAADSLRKEVEKSSAKVVGNKH